MCGSLSRCSRSHHVFGSLLCVADHVNRFFQEVAADLCPPSGAAMLPLPYSPMNAFVTERSTDGSLTRRTIVGRVHTFRLLGVHVSINLKWKEHVNAIASKVASCLYFLKLLKRAASCIFI